MNNSVVRVTDVDAHDYLRDLPSLDVGHDKVTLIIGQDNSDALQPLELLRTESRAEPFAVRTP